MILTTARLTLRPTQEADLPLLLAIQEQRELIGRWDHPNMRDPDATIDRLSGFLSQTESQRGPAWTVSRTEDGLVLGEVDLFAETTQDDSATLGFMLGMGTSGNGLAREAVHAVLVHATSVPLKIVWTRVLHGARNSEQLVMSLGFSIRAHLRGEVDRDRERRDNRLFALLL